MRSFWRGMMAVCGIGTPSGYLNSAVTANQSASAPIIAASANARRNPSQPMLPSNDRVIRNTIAMATSKPVASNFMRVSLFR